MTTFIYVTGGDVRTCDSRSSQAETPIESRYENSPLFGLVNWVSDTVITAASLGSHSREIPGRRYPEAAETADVYNAVHLLNAAADNAHDFPPADLTARGPVTARSGGVRERRRLPLSTHVQLVCS